MAAFPTGKMVLSPWAGIQHLSAPLCPLEGLGDKCQGPQIGRDQCLRALVCHSQRSAFPF